jgi:hypothetical protein
VQFTRLTDSLVIRPVGVDQLTRCRDVTAQLWTVRVTTRVRTREHGAFTVMPSSPNSGPMRTTVQSVA